MGIDISPAVARIQKILHDVIANVPNTILALIVIAVFIGIAKLARSLVQRLTHERVGLETAGQAIGRLCQGVVLLIGLLVSLSVALPTFKPTDVIQLLGIGSVAIGFAFRDIFQNFLAGILLLITQPFRIGDQIVVSGYEGTVEDIQTRATLIRTYDGRRVVIPNGDLFTQKVMVNTAFPRRRVEYVVGIGYGDDIELAKRLIVEAIHECPNALKEPKPDAVLVDLAASSVNLKLRFWIEPAKQSDYTRARDIVLTAVKNKFNEAGIDLPYPTQQILLHDQTETTDGDRSNQREGWPVGNKSAPGPAPRNGAHHDHEEEHVKG